MKTVKEESEEVLSAKLMNLQQYMIRKSTISQKLSKEQMWLTWN